MNQNHIRCLKCSTLMQPVMTKKGVLIDICPTCQGVWLDHGEINVFAKNFDILREYWHFGLLKPHPIAHPCPKCHHSSLKRGKFPELACQVEECPSCRGIYFDADEFKKLQGHKSFEKIQQDRSVSTKQTKATQHYSPNVKLPSFALTTSVVGVSLYGLLFGVVVFLMETAHLPLWAGTLGFIAIIFFQFLFSPIILDWQLKFLGSLDWVPLSKLPTHFKDSLIQLCRDHNLPLPRVGIIRDRSPQAYTYGRTPYSARLVFSEGMFEILDEDEVKAVLAHELGHIKHWDFVVMTVIKVVPILLYNVYVKLRRFIAYRYSLPEGRSGDGGTGGGDQVLAIIVYIFYLLSEYLVLFVSRVREYHADKFSCFATKNPNKLITALIKISYGLLESSFVERKAVQTEAKENSTSMIQSTYRQKTSQTTNVQAEYRVGVEALNIMGLKGSKQLAIVQQNSETFNPESIKDIMRWDLWNPWAFYYELNSTHPLTAKRINAISSYALALNQKPYILFRKQKPESYWDDFFFDLFIVLLPYILGILGAIFYMFFGHLTWDQILNNPGWNLLIPFGASFILPFCVGCLVRIFSAYPTNDGKFLPCSVAALLKIIKVSPVQSYPVILKGKVLGRGDPGQVLSEDFIFQDKTGIIFLNHEPFGLNLWFGLVHFKKFQGKEVIVKGWYRRSPIPMIEVKTIQSPGYISRAYTYHYKLAFASVGIVLSLLALWYLK